MVMSEQEHMEDPDEFLLFDCESKTTLKNSLLKKNGMLSNSTASHTEA
jgi:hypothetical protein